MLYIFVYTDYIAVYGRRFSYIYLILFPTRLAHNAGLFCIGEKKNKNNMLVIFPPDHSLPIAYGRIRAAFLEKF